MKLAPVTSYVDIGALTFKCVNARLSHPPFAHTCAPGSMHPAIPPDTRPPHDAARDRGEGDLPPRVRHRDDRAPESPSSYAQRRSNQRLVIDLIGFCLSALTRTCDRGRIEDVAFDLLSLRNLVDPEAVEACLLDEDKWEDLPVLIRAFSRSCAKHSRSPATLPPRIACFDISISRLATAVW